MTFFVDVLPTIPITDEGWDYQFCDRVWLVASVNTFEEVPDGRPVFLCRGEDGSLYWSYDFEDETFAFRSVADAKAQLAIADHYTSLRLHLLSVGDLLRYERAERVGEKFSPSVLSQSFFSYKNDPSRWSNKRGA